MISSTKRIFLSIISFALTLTIIVSVAPMTVFATSNHRRNSLTPEELATAFSDKTNWTDEIVEEVKSERDEFSKTYLLTDGSYYKVSSSTAIHFFENGEWYDISNTLSETPSTISNANDGIALASTVTSDSYYEDNSFTTQCVGTTTMADGVITFKADGAILIKPSSIYEYSSNDKLVLEATLTLETTSTAKAYMYAREVDSSWEEITDYTDAVSGQLIDYEPTTNGTTTLSFNITDIFSKWERGTTSPNGIALSIPEAQTRKSYTANNPVISVRYIDVSENDSKFTKHSLDMGAAGTLYINDVTNTAKIVQDIIGIDLQVLPVNITKTIYSPVNDFDSTSGINSFWNYNNTISLEGNILTWTKFDGSIIKFTKPEENIVVNDDGYQKWLPISSTGLTLNAELWISEDIADSDGLNTDYSLCYITLNDSTYYFNITGAIALIQKYGKQIQFTYGSLGLSSITDPVGNKYSFSYSRYYIDIEPHYYVSKISVKKSDNSAVKIDGVDYCVTFNNIYNSQTQKITSTTTFCDGKTVSYIYDLYGRLCEVVDAEGKSVVLDYINSTSNICTGYTQYSTDEVPVILSSIDITSENTFSRVFVDDADETEIMRFDPNYNLITNHYKGNVVALDYDNETNLITSYAFKTDKEKENLISNGTFETLSGWENNELIEADVNSNGRLEILGNIDKNCIVTNIVEPILSADSTYVLEAEAITTDVATGPSPDSTGVFGIAICVYDSDLNELETLTYTFDNTLTCEYDGSRETDGQLRMIALKFEEDVYVDVIIYEYGLTGTFEFDNIKLYEASEDDAFVGLPNMDNSSPITTSDSNGNIIKETIEREPYSMVQTYSYTDDGSKLTSMTDYNGLTTYYSYDDAGLLSQKGHSIDVNGNIVDPTVYVCNASGLISQITQTVTDVVDNSEKTMSTEYLYDNSNRITSVTNNGISYRVSYDENGNTTTVSKQIGSQDATALNNYSYNNNSLNEIIYSNGAKTTYTYDESTGNISSISNYNIDQDSNEYALSETFTYTYDEYNNIVGVVVDYATLATDYKIEYTDTGFKLYNIIGEQEILVFEKSETETSYTEKHLSTVTGENVLETFHQTKYAYVTDEITSATTGSSTITGTKASALFDDTTAEYSIQNSTTLDTFDRVTNRHSIMSTDITNTTNEIREANVDLLQQYSYESSIGLNESTTTGKIASITTTANGQLNVDNEITSHNWSMNSHYVYDDEGNLQLVYAFTGETYELVAFYAYDEAGQIITECDNTIGNVVYQYSYNTNGNLSKKYFYTGEVNINGLSATELQNIQSISAENWDEFDFSEIKTKTLTLSGQPSKVVELNYTNDKVTNYTEKTYDYSSEEPIITTTVSIDIPYDQYGNPLKHVEYNVLEIVVSDLTWTGNLLTSSVIYDTNNTTLPTSKYIYKYDENGYRTEKIQYEYDSSTQTYSENMRYRYVWDNGVLQSIHLFEYNGEGQIAEYYTNMIYDEKGYPCGYVDSSGNPFYFIRDINDSVIALVSGDGNKAVTIDYDAFGAVNMTANGSNALESVLYVILAQLNPCTYKGYSYDHETGMYFIKNRCYSPSMGRFIDNNFETITTTANSVLEANTSVFCSNNPISNNDVYGSWARETQVINWSNESLEVKMNKSFLSATFCTIYANQIVKQYGTFDHNKGNCIYGMDVERIASNLFARSVGKYAEKSLNRVNATWGQGWLMPNRNNNIIVVQAGDPFATKYLKIWYAAENIRNEALKDGIFLSF